MATYFIQLSTWGTNTPNIIDDETMYQAEHGMNYLDPDDFGYLCEADSMHDAEEFYDEELSDAIFMAIAERDHP